MQLWEADLSWPLRRPYIPTVSEEFSRIDQPETEPGFPHPENVALSDHLEQTVRDHGAIPATIGILNGVVRVGMSRKESHELLATSRQPTTMKISRRDIGYICGLVGSAILIDAVLIYNRE